MENQWLTFRLGLPERGGRLYWRTALLAWRVMWRQPSSRRMRLWFWWLVFFVMPRLHPALVADRFQHANLQELASAVLLIHLVFAVGLLLLAPLEVMFYRLCRALLDTADWVSGLSLGRRICRAHDGECILRVDGVGRRLVLPAYPGGSNLPQEICCVVTLGDHAVLVHLPDAGLPWVGLWFKDCSEREKFLDILRATNVPVRIAERCPEQPQWWVRQGSYGVRTSPTQQMVLLSNSKAARLSALVPRLWRSVPSATCFVVPLMAFLMLAVASWPELFASWYLRTRFNPLDSARSVLILVGIAGIVYFVFLVGLSLLAKSETGRRKAAPMQDATKRNSGAAAVGDSDDSIKTRRQALRWFRSIRADLSDRVTIRNIEAMMPLAFAAGVLGPGLLALAAWILRVSGGGLELQETLWLIWYAWAWSELWVFLAAVFMITAFCAAAGEQACILAGSLLGRRSSPVTELEWSPLPTSGEGHGVLVLPYGWGAAGLPQPVCCAAASGELLVVRSPDGPLTHAIWFKDPQASAKVTERVMARGVRVSDRSLGCVWCVEEALWSGWGSERGQDDGRTGDGKPSMMISVACYPTSIRQAFWPWIWCSVGLYMRLLPRRLRPAAIGTVLLYPPLFATANVVNLGNALLRVVPYGLAVLLAAEVVAMGYAMAAARRWLCGRDI